MYKCKDCKHFRKDCGFSKVDEQLGLDGEFVACGQFVAKEDSQDRNLGRGFIVPRLKDSKYQS